MLPHRGEGLIDRSAKLADLLARAHLHRQRDSARALPVALGVAPGIKVQVAWGALIGSGNVYEVTEVYWAACGRGGDQSVGDLVRVLELTGGCNEQILSLDLHCPTGEGD